MKKNIKQTLEVVTRILITLVVVFSSFAHVATVFAQSPVRGQIQDATQTVGSTTTQGDVELKKVITQTEDEGIFNVSLTATGKNTLETSSSVVPVYTVVVLDTSYSMRDLRCVRTDRYGRCEWEDVKYPKVVDGTKTFANTLLQKFSQAQLALVTFSNNVTVKRDFENANFNSVSFPEPNGGTNLGGAISKANELLTAKKTESENAKLYMVILSDGSPRGQTVNHTTAANLAKQNGIEIFTIGYDVDNQAKTLLQGVATDSNHYVDSNTSSIVEDFTNITGQIQVSVPAGTNATVTDVIADGFTYVEGSANPQTAVVDGNKITFNMKEITEAGTTVSFKIKINKDIADGWYKTNDGASISYTNSKNENTKKEITNSSKIYWEQQKYNYTINYYQDSLNGTLLGSETNQAVINTEIKSSDINVNKYRPNTGYQSGVIDTNMPYIIIDGTNVINIIYSKKDNLNYIVEYYQDGGKISQDSDNTVGSQTFGDSIAAADININKYKPLLGYQDGTIQNQMPYTIIDGDNIIKVCYEKRDDMTYQVQYLEQGSNNELFSTQTRNGKTYQETYTEEALDAPEGYRLVGNTSQQITVDQDNKTITFYYEKRDDYSYQVHYLEQGSNKVLSEDVVKTNKTYQETYKENALDITGYDVVGETAQSFTLTKDNQEITFYYTKRTDLTYQINYYQDSLDGKLLGSDIVENQTFESIITENEIDVDLYRPTLGYQEGKIVTDMPYTVQEEGDTINIVYTKKNDLQYRVEYYYDGIIDSSKTIFVENAVFGDIITNYVEKQPDGYQFIRDTGELIIQDSEENVIKVYYESIPQGDQVEPPKTGIETNSYLGIICLIATLSYITIVRKQEN